MCTVSMVAQDWSDRNAGRWNQPQWNFIPPQVSREEFDALKAELESIKKLLAAAKLYDTETGQPDCEDDEKIALFKKLAGVLGVDMSDVFPVKAK